MARQRFLKNAPITEGLIDIRTRARSDFDIQALTALAARLEPDYSNKGQIVHQEVNVQLSADAPASTHAVSRDFGFRYHSCDDKYVAQFRLNGFTLSRLAPYETWEKLSGEARRLWTIYLECAAPETVTRVATRFINNLRLPMQHGDPFEAYLTASPQVPSPLPQSILAFLQRIVIHDPELDANANITQVWQPGTASDRVPVILDIDVYRESEFAPHAAEIWDYLQQLRALKNRAFFESLTEKAVELYE